MKTIPDTENTLIIRTDFSDQAAWEQLCAEIRKPVSIFQFVAYVNYLDDPEFADLPKEELLKRLPSRHNHGFLIVADRMTMVHAEHPLLIIDLFDDTKRDFRVIPRQIQAIENNLSIANMDFEDFADSVDQDGIFRGFPGDPYNS